MSVINSQSAVIPVSEFQDELRRLARYSRSATPEDPLAAIVQRIVQNPAFSESRLLTRLLAAVTSQHGDFRLAEAAVFHSQTLALIVSFLDMVGSGAFSNSQCRTAV